MTGAQGPPNLPASFSTFPETNFTEEQQLVAVPMEKIVRSDYYFEKTVRVALFAFF